MTEAGLDERVARLEGRVDGFEGRFDAIDRRFEAIDRRFDGLELRIQGIDEKVDRFRVELAARIDALDRTASSHFTWLVGIQITVLVAVIAALLRG